MQRVWHFQVQFPYVNATAYQSVSKVDTSNPLVVQKLFQARGNGLNIARYLLKSVRRERLTEPETKSMSILGYQSPSPRTEEVPFHGLGSFSSVQPGKHEVR